jgi:hypothetical protein
MHALRLPAAAVSELVGDESDGWSVAVLELGFEQPATRRLAAPMAATILSGWRKWVSSFVPPSGGENVRLTLMHASVHVATAWRVVRGVGKGVTHP